ncbi:unnamed protein product [Protopolystoma xenopodis]|uniref:Uncharacterized protein n=1 Tax=Protopolystoma xenopodis TaxID=117903 RepID=A0A3S5AZW3_9PLAT|nr:unnamed protein product [Protopolystoma xenopodis]
MAKLYGAALCFYEPYDVTRLDNDKCYRLSIDPELALALRHRNCFRSRANEPDSSGVVSPPDLPQGQVKNVGIRDTLEEEVPGEENGEEEKNECMNPASFDFNQNRLGHFSQSRVGDRVIGVTKSICLLSRWSFSDAFRQFLLFLYERCLLPLTNVSNCVFDASLFALTSGPSLTPSMPPLER